MENPLVAREFFEKNLPPEVLKAIDLQSLTIQPESFIDDSLKLQIADVLFTADFDGEQGYVYLLFEHMSTARKMLSYRMLCYVMGIMKRHLDTHKGSTTLPFVYPMILYTGEKPYAQTLNLFDLFGDKKILAEKFMFGPLHLLDLAQTSYDTLQQQYHFFKLAAFLGKCVHLPDMLPILKQLVGIIRQMDESGEDTYVIKSIQYMFTVGEIGDKKAYTEAMEENIGSTEKEKVMTIADMLRQEGREQAKEEVVTIADMLRQEGRQEGRQEAMALADQLKDMAMVIKNMMAEGSTLEFIAKVTGLKIENIQKIVQ